MMKNRKRLLFGVFLPLFIGAIIYIVLSPNAYLTKLFWNMIRIDNPFVGVRVSKMHIVVRMIRYYLCDFMWALALTQSIIVILGDKNLLISGFVGIGFCSVCEIAQLFDSVPGTFDHIDLIVENLAVIFSILTSLFIRRLHYEKGS